MFQTTNQKLVLQWFCRLLIWRKWCYVDGSNFFYPPVSSNMVCWTITQKCSMSFPIQTPTCKQFSIATFDNHMVHQLFVSVSIIILSRAGIWAFEKPNQSLVLFVSAFNPVQIIPFQHDGSKNVLTCSDLFCPKKKLTGSESKTPLKSCTTQRRTKEDHYTEENAKKYVQKPEGVQKISRPWKILKAKISGIRNAGRIFKIPKNQDLGAHKGSLSEAVLCRIRVLPSHHYRIKV